ncbi:ABC transporter permease [Nonomuraea antimicrobica]
MNREQASRVLQQHGAVMVLGMLVIVGSLAFDSFATPANAASVVVSSSFLAIIAIGMTFVIISGGIDLSVGSLFVLGGVLAAYGSQYGPLVALALPLAVCGVVGLLQGLVIARTGMAPFIVTLAGLLGVRGLMLAISDEGATTYLVEDRAFAALGQGRSSACPTRSTSPPSWPWSRWCCCSVRASARTSTPSAATSRRRP